MCRVAAVGRRGPSIRKQCPSAEPRARVPPCDAGPCRWRRPALPPPAPRPREKDCSAARDRLALELRDCPDWHHFARNIAGLEAGYILRGAPEIGIALNPDLIGAAKIVEVVHILPAEIDLQRRKDVSRRQPHLLRFQPVDVGLDRRRTGVDSVNTPTNFGSLFAAATRARAALSSASEPSPARSSSIAVNDHFQSTSAATNHYRFSAANGAILVRC